MVSNSTLLLVWPIAALAIAVLTLWTSSSIWLTAVACVFAAGYASGVLHGPAVLWLIAVAACAWQLRTSRRWSRAAWIAATLTLGLLLGLHLLPGFTNPAVVRDAVLNSGAAPYSQYINFDKTLGGILLLGCSGWVPMRSPADWVASLRRAAPLIIVTIAIAMAASLVLGFVRLDPRWTSFFPIWAAINLLTTCVSEEAFFRGLIQTEVKRAIHSREAGAVAMAVSAVAFGLAHVAGGWNYVIVATLAGGGYAAVYQQTARLEMAILAHFALNAIHFLLFTYPALA